MELLPDTYHGFHVSICPVTQLEFSLLREDGEACICHRILEERAGLGRRRGEMKCVGGCKQDVGRI